MSNRLCLALMESLGISHFPVKRMTLTMAPRELNTVEIVTEVWDQELREFHDVMTEYSLEKKEAPDPKAEGSTRDGKQ